VSHRTQRLDTDRLSSITSTSSQPPTHNPSQLIPPPKRRRSPNNRRTHNSNRPNHPRQRQIPHEPMDLYESLRIVRSRKLPLRHRLAQKLAKRPPTLLHMILKQPLLRRNSSNPRIMIVESLPRRPIRRVIRQSPIRRRTHDLAVLPPGPHERGIPLGQCLPASPAQDAAGGAVHAVQPLVDVAVVEHDFGFGVRGDELFGEADGGDVFDAVVVA